MNQLLKILRHNLAQFTKSLFDGGSLNAEYFPFIRNAGKGTLTPHNLALTPRWR